MQRVNSSIALAKIMSAFTQDILVLFALTSKVGTDMMELWDIFTSN